MCEGSEEESGTGKHTNCRTLNWPGTRERTVVIFSFCTHSYDREEAAIAQPLTGEITVHLGAVIEMSFAKFAASQFTLAPSFPATFSLHGPLPQYKATLNLNEGAILDGFVYQIKEHRRQFQASVVGKV